MAANKTPYIKTQRRIIAWERSNKIRDLRMMYGRAHRDHGEIFTKLERQRLLNIFDRALKRLKAEPETARRERERAELLETWK